MSNLVGRAFLVGCSRSGTTVLQHHLARHTEIHSLPETDYFGRLLGNPFWRTIGRFGRVRGSKARRAQEKLREATQEDRISISGVFPRTATCVAAFVRCLDEETQAAGKRVWLEKTPKHYRYVREIQQFIPDARIIHLIRDGRAVVASIHDRATRYPEEFGHQADPAYGVKLWNRAVRQALKRRTDRAEAVIFYEDFVTHPQATLERVCGLLEVDFEPGMLTGETAGVQQIARPEEAWKDGAGNGVQAVASKFDSVFGPSQRAWINKHLDWRSYERLRQSPHSAGP